jgi:AcrR family transcriptional regulator
VQVAGTSHGTFYLYFSSREDLLGALIHDALGDMDAVVSAFPAGRRG